LANKHRAIIANTVAQIILSRQRNKDQLDLHAGL